MRNISKRGQNYRHDVECHVRWYGRYKGEIDGIRYSTSSHIPRTIQRLPIMPEGTMKALWYNAVRPVDCLHRRAT